MLPKIIHTRFLVLPFGKEEAVVLYPGLPGHPSCRPSAVLGALPVDHGIEVIRPAGVFGPEIAVAHGREGGHGLTDPSDLLFRNAPHGHGVPPVSGDLVSENRPKTSDHPPADEPPNPFQELLFFDPDFFARGANGAGETVRSP